MKRNTSIRTVCQCFIFIGSGALLAVGAIAMIFALSNIMLRIPPNIKFSDKLQTTVIPNIIPWSSYDEKGLVIDTMVEGLQRQLNDAGISCKVILDSKLSGKKAWWPESDFSGVNGNFTALSWVSGISHYFDCNYTLIDGNMIVFYAKEGKEKEKWKDVRRD